MKYGVLPNLYCLFNYLGKILEELKREGLRKLPIDGLSQIRQRCRIWDKPGQRLTGKTGKKYPGSLV